MPQAKLTIWCNANNFAHSARSLLRAGAEPHRVVFADEQDGQSAEQLLTEADVAFGQPPPDAAIKSSALRWLHLNSAGYTAYDRQDLRDALAKRGATLTNSSSVYSEPCAQHLLAMMLSLARQLPQSLDEQRGARAWSDDQIRANSVLLTDQTALLLGFGAIARRLVELLRPLGINIIAARRRVAGDESVRAVELSEVESYVPLADHIVNILPAHESTKHFLDARRLAAVKRGVIIYNIGRGTTVEQTALIRGLESGQVAAAYLDVTEPEPLPPDHPLWSAPNCLITPHTAGGHANESERLVRHFLENLNRFIANEPLVDRVF
ncbi:MAG: D-2-hydroxyacid dehydrogenase [Pyrinomonadaceae bacterium]